MDIDNRSLNDRMVIYTGASDSQVSYGGGSDPRELLVIGSIYQVDDLDVQDWSSTVTLVGVEGRFNTVFFDEDENEDEDESRDVTRNTEAEIKYILEGDGSTESRVEDRLRIVLDNLHDDVDFLSEMRKQLQDKLTKVDAVMRGEL